MIRPTRNTANAILEQLSIDSPNDLASRPYIYLDLARKRWAHPIIEHQSANEAWGVDVRNYPNPKPASIQQYLLFRLRFISEADIAHAFDSFGWAGAQFNNIGISLIRPIIDAPASPIESGQYLHKNCRSLLGNEPLPSIIIISL